MRRVARGAGPVDPEHLTKVAEELDKARAHYTEPKDGSYEFKIYKAAAIKAELDKLFHGKCAYCERFFASGAPVDVEHYRPKGGVEGDKTHRGYWWLATEWSNLLPSCIDCNRRRGQRTPRPETSLERLDEHARVRFSASRLVTTGKQNAFPISGVRARRETDDLTLEQPLLLNPCEQDPADHMSFHVDGAAPIALAFPKRTGDAAARLPIAEKDLDRIAADAATDALSVLGAVSIQVYGLNRLGLVQERTELLRRLQLLGDIAVEVSTIAEDLEPAASPEVARAIDRLEFLREMLLAEMQRLGEPHQPHSTMVNAWIRSFIAELFR